MKHSIQVQARGPNKAEILIYSAIGEGFFGDGLTAAQFDADLKALGTVAEILVRINSPGGAIWDGFAIYNTLKNHPARINVRIDGLAASCASVIAMVGHRVEMGAGSMLMIHEPWSMITGHADEMRNHADLLDQVKVGMVEAYVSRTGLSRGRILQIMQAETWFTADEAISEKFADGYVEVTEPSPHIAAADWSAVFAQFKHLPASLKRKPPMDEPNTPAAGVSPEARRREDLNTLFADLRGMDSLKDKSPFLDNLQARALLSPHMDPQSIRNQVLEELARGQEPLRIGIPDHVRDSSGNFTAAAADGLLLRAGIKIPGVHPAAGDVQSLSVHDIARTCMAQAGRRDGYLSGQRLIKAAMTTSDFPLILENALHKAVRKGYESEPASHRQWVRVQPIADFREQPRPILGSAPDLLEVVEMGEYKHGAMDDDKATYSVTKWGRIVALSWEALVNDDLGAFLRVQPALGQAARRKEADVIYALLTDNTGDGQTMQDSVVLFHSSHTNIATGGALGAATLGEARALLRKQTAVGGGLLSLVPRFLIVGADLETDAEILLASATRYLASGSDAAQPEWISKLELVVEPRLDDSAFYLAAGPEQIDTVELGILDADGPGPAIEEEASFDTDAKRWKVRHTFGARFLDWRGIVKVPTEEEE